MASLLADWFWACHKRSPCPQRISMAASTSHQWTRWSTSKSGAGCVARSQSGNDSTASSICASPQACHSGGLRAGEMRGGSESTPMPLRMCRMHAGSWCTQPMPRRRGHARVSTASAWRADSGRWHIGTAIACDVSHCTRIAMRLAISRGRRGIMFSRMHADANLSRTGFTPSCRSRAKSGVRRSLRSRKHGALFSGGVTG